MRGGQIRYSSDTPEEFTVLPGVAAPNPQPMPATALSLLQDLYGYPAFRGQQAAVIDTVAGGGDAMVLMPTGGGKSVCYQIPALLR